MVGHVGEADDVREHDADAAVPLGVHDVALIVVRRVLRLGEGGRGRSPQAVGGLKRNHGVGPCETHQGPGSSCTSGRARSSSASHRATQALCLHLCGQGTCPSSSLLLHDLLAGCWLLNRLDASTEICRWDGLSRCTCIWRRSSLLPDQAPGQRDGHGRGGGPLQRGRRLPEVWRGPSGRLRGPRAPVGGHCLPGLRRWLPRHRAGWRPLLLSPDWSRLLRGLLWRWSGAASEGRVELQ